MTTPEASFSKNLARVWAIPAAIVKVLWRCFHGGLKRALAARIRADVASRLLMSPREAGGG